MPSLVFFSPGWYNPLIKTKGVRSMKRCLVLSDSFKGTLSSPDICRIARSLHIPGWHIDALPVADGGEGTTDCFLDACGGQRIALSVSTASTACCQTGRRWWSAPQQRACTRPRAVPTRRRPPPTVWDSFWPTRWITAQSA